MAGNESTLEFVIKLRGGQTAAEDARRVEKAVAGVGGKMKRVSEEGERASKRTSLFGGSLKKMAVGLGAVGAGYAAWSAAKGAITYTDELAKNSRVLGKATNMSTAESSRFVGVANAMGVESTKLGMLFVKLGKATDKQAESTGKHATAFDKLGISQAWAKAHMNDTAGVLDMVTHKLATENIPATEKSALMMELFGRSWQSLGPLLTEGEVGLSKYLKVAKEMGVEIGGNGAEALHKFHEQQVESKLAMEGLQISFTKMIAGPLGGMIGGFSRLVKFAKAKDWAGFNREVDKIGRNLSALAEKVLPKMAEGFARIAPAVLKAFFNGFLHASVGGQAFLAGAILLKTGLAGSAAKALFKGAGLSAGLVFELAFIGALGYLGFELGKKLGEWVHNLHFHFDLSRILHGQSPIWVTEGPSAAELSALGGRREKAMLARGAANSPLTPSHYHIDPHAPKGTLHNPILKGAAAGGIVSRSGLLEVGERGPEVVHLPQSAMIDPLKPGSLADNRPIILKVDGRVLARVNRRELLQSQAAGA